MSEGCNRVCSFVFHPFTAGVSDIARGLSCKEKITIHKRILLVFLGIFELMPVINYPTYQLTRWLFKPILPKSPDVSSTETPRAPLVTLSSTSTTASGSNSTSHSPPPDTFSATSTPPLSSAPSSSASPLISAALERQPTPPEHSPPRGSPAPAHAAPVSVTVATVAHAASPVLGPRLVATPFIPGSVHSTPSALTPATTTPAPAITTEMLCKMAPETDNPESLLPHQQVLYYYNESVVTHDPYAVFSLVGLCGSRSYPMVGLGNFDHSIKIFLDAREWGSQAIKEKEQETEAVRRELEGIRDQLSEANHHLEDLEANTKDRKSLANDSEFKKWSEEVEHLKSIEAEMEKSVKEAGKEYSNLYSVWQQFEVLYNENIKGSQSTVTTLSGRVIASAEYSYREGIRLFNAAMEMLERSIPVNIMGLSAKERAAIESSSKATELAAVEASKIGRSKKILHSAIQAFTRAGNNNHLEACVKLRDLYFRGNKGILRSLPDALEWAVKAVHIAHAHLASNPRNLRMERAFMIAQNWFLSATRHIKDPAILDRFNKAHEEIAKQYAQKNSTDIVVM